MNLISQYVLRVAAYVIFSLILEEITPKGSNKKIVKLMLSLIFMYVLIQPVVEWIGQDLSLSQLTMEEVSWSDAKEDRKIDYEKQAWNMVEKGYEQVLKQQGLPKELEDEYYLQEVSIGEVVEVTLARGGAIGGFDDRSLELGQIGSSQEEEKRVISSLSNHWGIPEEKLEMKLR